MSNPLTIAATVDGNGLFLSDKLYGTTFSKLRISNPQLGVYKLKFPNIFDGPPSLVVTVNWRNPVGQWIAFTEELTSDSAIIHIYDGDKKAKSGFSFILVGNRLQAQPASQPAGGLDDS